jgi:hypothetical protein
MLSAGKSNPRVPVVSSARRASPITTSADAQIRPPLVHRPEAVGGKCVPTADGGGKPFVARDKEELP